MPGFEKPFEKCKYQGTKSAMTKSYEPCFKMEGIMSGKHISSSNLLPKLVTELIVYHWPYDINQ